MSVASYVLFVLFRWNLFAFFVMLIPYNVLLTVVLYNTYFQENTIAIY